LENIDKDVDDHLKKR